MIQTPSLIRSLLIPLFLLPYPEREKFDSLPKESFAIVEVQKDSFVVRRRGWCDIKEVLLNAGLPVKEELDTK